MKEPSFLGYLLVVVCCLLLAMPGLYFLANFGRLFRGKIRNEWVRQNLLVWFIVLFLSSAMVPLSNSFFYMLHHKGWFHILVAQFLSTTVTTIFVFNLAKLVAMNKRLKRLPFLKHKLIIVATIVASMIVSNIPMTYWLFGNNPQVIKYGIISSMYIGATIGLVYMATAYLELERQRKYDEKELEVSKLQALKSKAELDALHSKVNPHFLYNALNSIADLSITDGKKARKMTIALADLFRYSINYSQNNYSTVNDEVAMTEVYLQIEKIRFEDQLSYTVHVAEDAGHFLLPRFLLQPLVENAVKHGLKATGKITEITLDIKLEGAQMTLTLFDNGPAFPEELLPGYGLKSVFDKLDLLFPDQYEIYFKNEPKKQVSIVLKKLMKNEPAV